jgi:universal stress protein E
MTPTASVALVATDFSPLAQRAAERAATLALAQGLSLQLLHVLNHDWMTTLRSWLGEQGGQLARLSQASADQLGTEAERLRSLYPGLALSARLLEGQPVSGVDQAAADLPAAWVALGVRGSTPMHQLLIGTTAERLLRKTTHPLLVVRQPVDTAYRRVLVPVDFSPWSQAAVALALRFAPQADLVLMHTFSVPFEEKLRFAGVDDDTVGLYRDKARLLALQQL